MPDTLGGTHKLMSIDWVGESAADGGDALLEEEGLESPRLRSEGRITSLKLRPIIFPRLATPPLTQTRGF